MRFCVILAALVLLPSPKAAAEGMGFDGEIPKTPHTWLTLTNALWRVVAGAPTSEFQGHAVKSVELVLTAQQRAILRRQAGTAPTYIGAVSVPILSMDCTCGSTNVASLSPDETRMAVIHVFIVSPRRTPS